MATVIGSWSRLPAGRTAARERSSAAGSAALASDYSTLHPPRPSGRSPHRPLTFLGRFPPRTGRDSARMREKAGGGSGFRLEYHFVDTLAGVEQKTGQPPEMKKGAGASPLSSN